MTAISSTTILFGVLLTLLGLGGYFLTGATSPTALIPAVFGFLLVALGLLARSEPMRKHAMHASATIALVGCGGGLFSLMRASATVDLKCVERQSSVHIAPYVTSLW